MSLQAAGTISPSGGGTEIRLVLGTATRGRTGRSISPSASRGSWRPPGRMSPNTATNARSNRSRSAWLEHRTVRSASRASFRDAGSTAASARCASTSSPTPSRTPSARSSAVSAPSGPVTGSDTLEHLALTDPQDVLVDLQRRTERLIEVGLVSKRQERPGPDERLPHSGQLVQVALLAQPADGC